MHFRYVVSEMQNVFVRSLMFQEPKTQRAGWAIACPLNHIHKIRSRKYFARSEYRTQAIFAPRETEATMCCYLLVCIKLHSIIANVIYIIQTHL